MTADQYVEAALSHLGECEMPRHSNTGVFVDSCLAAVNCGPGQAWCAAFACKVLRDCNGGAYPYWFRPSAGALSLWHSNDNLWVNRGELPQRGDIVIWSHGHGLGHVAIVDQPSNVDMRTVAGNTTNGRNYADPHEDIGKSREGDQVGCNVYPMKDTRIVGYLRPKWSES